ncbi:hypothetical protein ACFOWZ_07320 [Lentzea rhizosphaerae]|uniref:Ig-like domain-containing protein n=1 Tax=Lentzea rhizosphaerae TaxID=2041025 RepID=A0ABV8BLS2_9PSEU
MASADLIGELNELRRGRGVQADNLHLLPLPNLRRVCGVGTTDAPAAVRDKLVLRLTELCGRLPADLRMAALAALALHEEANHRFLHERMAWLNGQINRDSLRTARRWINAAFKRLAHDLESAGGDNGSHHAPCGWYTESLSSSLNMELDPPQLTETRQIVATSDELDEIVIMISAPKGVELADDERVEATIEYGGRIVETEHDPSGHSRFVVRLPEPLGLGERHTYSVRFTSFPRRRMKPYYVLLPLRRVERFEMHVRFPTQECPSRIWRLNGVPPVVLDAGRPAEALLALDTAGEIGLEFFGLREGLAYGAAWIND